MKHTIIILSIAINLCFFGGDVIAQSWPEHVQVIQVKPNEIVEVTGKIDNGKAIVLGFAERSSNACFVAPAFDHYRGNHVFLQPKFRNTQRCSSRLHQMTAQVRLTSTPTKLEQPISHSPLNCPVV